MAWTKMTRMIIYLLLVIYALILPLLSIIAGPFISICFGMPLVVVAAIVRGTQGGVLAAVWSSLIVILGTIYFQGAIDYHYIVLGIIFYCILGICLGISVNHNWRLQKDLDNKEKEASTYQSLFNESERRVKSLTNNVPGAIYRCKLDEEMTIEFISDDIQDISGYLASDFIQNKHKLYSDLIHPDDVKVVKESIEMAVHNHKPFDIEYRIIHCDSSIRWVNEKGQGVIDDDKTAKVDGIIFDITDYKQVQEERENLSIVVNRGPAVVIVWGNRNDWPIQFVSQNISQFGYRPKDFYSEHNVYIDIVHPEDVDRCLNDVKQYMIEERDNYELVYRIITKDEKIRWVKDWTWNVYDNKGNCIRREGIVLDITEQKEAEDALAAEKERLLVTLQSIGDGVIATDSEGNITLFNQVSEGLTGWDEKDALGKPLESVFHIINKETKAVCENPVKKVLENGGLVSLDENAVLISKDRKETSIADSAAPIFDTEGNILGVVLVFRDITLEKRDKELKARLYKETNYKLEESQSIQRVTSALLEKIDTEEVLDIVCSEAERLTGAKGSSIFMTNGSKCLKRVYSSGKMDPSCDSFPIRDSLVGLALQRGDAVLSNEAHSYAQGHEINSIIAIPLKTKGQSTGVLVVVEKPEGFTKEDLRVMEILGNQASVAIENARLYKQGQELAAVKERQRLARDLHDAVTQTLFSTSLIAEVLPRLWKNNRQEGERRLEELRQLTRGALAEMRTLLLELRPSGLTEVSIKELLNHLAEAVASRARIPVNVEVQGEPMLAPDIQVVFYRIAQESLNNIVKHSGATCAHIKLQCNNGVLALSIEDDGRGFDINNVSPENLGLGIMLERAQDVGAEFKVDSKPGKGTLVSVKWIESKELNHGE